MHGGGSTGILLSGSKEVPATPHCFPLLYGYGGGANMSNKNNNPVLYLYMYLLHALRVTTTHLLSASSEPQVH